MIQSTYHQNRKHFYEKVENFWPDLYGEEYALYDVYRANCEFVDQVHLATRKIGKIYFKVARLLREVDDHILVEMGFPRETLSFLRIAPFSSESVISRLDLVYTSGSIKCIEINADTPTFIKEVFSVNGDICEEFGLNDPNNGMDTMLAKEIEMSIKDHFDSSKPCHIVFAAHDDHVEDYNTTRYLQQICQLPSRFVPLHRLQIIKGSGLYDDLGNKIDLLYRQTFPIENLIQDQDDEGNPIGLWLLELVQMNKLKLINPPSAFLLQNKAVQAVIWGLHEERNPFFTEEEHNWISEHFLPTFLEPDYFLKNGQAFVKKPSFGREGDTVEVFDGKGHLKFADSQTSYTGFTPIYQQYIALPTASFDCEKGRQTGHWIIGSFLINGHPSGMALRIGNPITDNLSYFLPIGIE